MGAGVVEGKHKEKNGSKKKTQQSILNLETLKHLKVDSGLARPLKTERSEGRWEG